MSPHSNTDFFNGIGAYVPECNASLMSAFGPRALRDQWLKWGALQTGTFGAEN